MNNYILILGVIGALIYVIALAKSIHDYKKAKARLKETLKRNWEQLKAYSDIRKIKKEMRDEFNKAMGLK